jgi:hypothetical protein
MVTALYWIIALWGVIISYRRFRTAYRSHFQVSRIKKKAGDPSTGFKYRRAWAVENLISLSSCTFVSCCFTEIFLIALPVPSVTFLCEPLFRCGSAVLQFPPPSNFTCIYWFIVLVSWYPSCFGYDCPLFHTLMFVLSPGPAPVCLKWRSTKIFPPLYCFFVFIYQLHVLLSSLISFSHFAYIDGFLCFSPLADTMLLRIITATLFFKWTSF